MSPCDQQEPDGSVLRDERGHYFAQIDDALFDLGYVARLSGAAFKVYAVLCRSANRIDTAWPGQLRIAELAGLNPATVSTALTQLETLGLIGVERHVIHGRGNRYRLLAVPRARSAWPHPTSENPMWPPTHIGKSKVSPPENPMLSRYKEVEIKSPADSYRSPDNLASLPPVQESLLPDQRRGEAKAKRPPSGPLHDIIRAYCAVAQIEQPANYGKALGHAKALRRVGLEATNIATLYGWTKAQPWLKHGIDLGTLVTTAERWLAAGQPDAGTVETPDAAAERERMRQFAAAMRRDPKAADLGGQGKAVLY